MPSSSLRPRGLLAISVTTAVGFVLAMLPGSASAVVTATSDGLRGEAHDGVAAGCVEPAVASSARGGEGYERGRDHVEMSAAERAEVERRTDAILGSQGPAQARAARAAAGSIPVYVHVMRSKSGAGNVTRQQVKRQIAELNQDYAGRESAAASDTGFSFRLAGLDKFNNNSWHRDKSSGTYRAKTHRGGARALNIWAVDFDYLGIATFPWRYARAPELDGIRVNFETFPGGRARGYNLGKTVSHEAGHWLGLYHTFEGKCSTTNDLVQDTPAQAGPSSGCPRGRNSCRLPGDDPVHNYMDYSTDACYNQFTAGQSERMFQAFQAFRA